MNTFSPDQRPGTVEMVPVEWIMQHTTSSVDGYRIRNAEMMPSVDYEAMIKSKGTDEQIGHVVGAILNEGFRVPITLIPDRIDGLTHGDGHHRFTAAILLCLDEVPVFWSEQEWCPPESDTECLGDYPEWETLWEELEEIFYPV